MKMKKMVYRIMAFFTSICMTIIFVSAATTTKQMSKTINGAFYSAMMKYTFTMQIWLMVLLAVKQVKYLP